MKNLAWITLAVAGFYLYKELKSGIKTQEEQAVVAGVRG